MLNKLYNNRFTNRFFNLLIKKNFLLFLKIYCLFLKLNFIQSKKTNPNFISVINTHDQSGGASTIAFELSSNMIIKNYIKLFVKYKKRNDEWINEISNRKKNFIEVLLNEEAKQKGWINFVGFDSLNLLNDYHFKKSRIIHLHNIHENFLSPAIFSLLFKYKKVIWTLHDEFLITGHCGSTMLCDNWKNGCGKCPDLSIYPSVKYDNTEKVLKNKIIWINKLKPFIITPSYWLENRIKKTYPKIKNIKTIHNGIDTKIFYKKNKIEAKVEYNLPIDKKIILFVAEFATLNPFKGGNILREIIKQNNHEEYFFVTVGGNNILNLKNHTSIHYISDKEKLANLYNACDVLLYPTQADNFPLVVLESMACGTPVIASKLGGIPEIISHNEDGFLIENYTNREEFEKILNEFFEFSEDKKKQIESNASNKIQQYFSLEIMIENYQKLYKTIDE